MKGPTHAGPLVWLLAPLLLATGCLSNVRRPDLGGLYDRAAHAHHEERNPIIVIPGLLGSRLKDADTGRQLWGAFGGKAASPKKPEDLRLLAMPLRQEDADARVVADGVLDRVKVKLLGLPLQVKAYYHILTMLGTAGFRDESLGLSGAVDYGDDHFTCFQFAYDWRLSNAENARRLHRFILDKQAYVKRELDKRGLGRDEVRFDIVAHSMGALVARYYLRYGTQGLPADGSLPELTWEGARYVERAILVAPPNAGSIEVLEHLVKGYKPGPLVARYPAALIGTFASVYELLPRARHGAYVDARPPHRPLGDVLEVELWRKLGWGLLDPEQDEVLSWLLPEVAERAERRRIAAAFLARRLARARQFQAALDQPAAPPPGTTLALIAGDSQPTDAVAAIDLESGAVEVTATAPGDGTVLRSSALMDERLGAETWRPTLETPITWHTVTFLFNDHLGLTRDATFTDNVLYQLMEERRSRGL